MKIFIRQADGFRVEDNLDRTSEWASETYGGSFTDVVPVAPTPAEIAKDRAKMRLAQIDDEAGPRAVREALIALNQKGFNNKIETLEAEAASLRAQL